MAEPTWETCAPDGIATLNCIPVVVKQVITYALIFAGVVAVLMIAYAGIRYITSRGDPKAVEGAQNTVTWAVIGLVVILLSFVVINFIAYFTGAECIKLFGFTNCP